MPFPDKHKRARSSIYRHHNFDTDLGVFSDRFDTGGIVDNSVQFSDAAGDIATRPVYSADLLPDDMIDSQPAGTFSCFTAQNFSLPRERRESPRSRRPFLRTST
jgi:hypothetical protein